MSGRSPSGVASLRARFEQNADPESTTPSRGRSPAGSINSDTSRPLSKVRTSFISVGESSGQMADLLEGKEASPAMGGDGQTESKSKEPTRPNGVGPTSAPRTVSGNPVKTSEEQKLPEAGKSMSEKPDKTSTASSSAAADSGKLAASGKDDTISAQPSGSTGKTTASNVAGGAKEGTDLGSILKGSAFEEGATTKEAASQKPTQSGTSVSKALPTKGSKTSAASASMDTGKGPSSKDKAVNGKPKESNATQSKPQAKPASEPPIALKSQGPSKPMASPDIKPLSNEPEKKAAPAKTAPAAGSVSSGEEKASAPDPTPPASSDTVATTKPPKNDPAPGRPTPAKEPLKEAPTAPKASTALPERKANPSLESSKSSTSKAAPPSAPAASKAPPKKAVHPSSPPTSGTGFVKPKPRSPTRPVNLPSHLTAQTAASAAKHGDDSHVEPHKDSTASKAKPSGPKAPTTHLPTHRKAPRASMPAAGSSKVAEKEKPKSRMSVAAGGGSASGGSSFLERMMRPTQSSAQKTADRAESSGRHSPPRKATAGTRSASGSGSGPKTVTGASTHKPDQHAHNDGGHGDGREKHGMLPSSSSAKSSAGHHAKEKGVSSTTTAAADHPSDASAPTKAEQPASAPEAVEEAKASITPAGIEEEKATTQADDVPAGPESGS